MMKSIPENAISLVKHKFIYKSMRLARQIGIDNDACWSRHIGTVITDSDGVILSTGYNGAARGLPHCDSAEYIREYLWPKLNNGEKTKLTSIAYGYDVLHNSFDEFVVPSKLDKCKQCPRKLLGYKSGERNELCYCAHSEQNAIISAKQSLKNAILFNWSPISCVPCAINIIQAGIKEVHFLDEIYDESSLTLYKFANIPIFLHTEEEINGII